MAHRCQKVQRKRGIFVEVMSGDGTGPICTIGGRTDIRHIVTVENKGGYPARVDCKGLIQTNPRSLKFSPNRVGSSVTPTAWLANHPYLLDKTQCAFSPANLHTDPPNAVGTQPVEAVVDIFWFQPGRGRQVAVSIHVDP